jgi:hypothetical protein
MSQHALAVHIMTNTALTGATYDIDGGPVRRRVAEEATVNSIDRNNSEGKRT